MKSAISEKCNDVNPRLNLFSIKSSVSLHFNIFGCLYHIAGTSGWDTDPVTGVEYQRNALSVLTWHQARKSCQQQGADLLSIVELHEQSYISGTKLVIYHYLLIAARQLTLL